MTERLPLPPVGLSRFGAQLRRARLAKGWTVAELAVDSGVSDRTIRRIENGEGSAQAGSLYLLAQALGVKVELSMVEPLAKGA